MHSIKDSHTIACSNHANTLIYIKFPAKAIDACKHCCVCYCDNFLQGKNCVQAAQAAYAAITRQDPNLHQVIVNLESLQEDGKNLAAYSEEEKRKAEATEQQLQAEMNGLNTEKQQIEANVMKLRQDQASAERTLAQQEATLKDEIASVGQMHERRSLQC